MPIAGHLYRFNLEYLICTALWPASLPSENPLTVTLPLHRPPLRSTMVTTLETPETSSLNGGVWPLPHCREAPR
ncbi:unnamed protein product, partial [Musa banksii]